MSDPLILVDGATFVCSQASGEITEGSPNGYFVRDVRHLSRWELLLDGKPPTCLSSAPVDYFSARAYLAADDDQPSLSIRRDRFVAGGVHEDLDVTNHAPEPVELVLELRFGSDFADVTEVQEGTRDGEGRRWTETTARSATLWYERDGFRRGTRISFTRNCDMGADGATFRLTLGAREQWHTCIDVEPIVGRERIEPLYGCDAFGKPEPDMPMTLAEWLETAPELDTDSDELRETYRQSLIDLAALRLRPSGSGRWPVPAGGVPWFMALFGRDALIASYQALPFHAELAAATLEALAERQATEHDHYRDAEPGKILHELRLGKLAELGLSPHSPYFGAHDTTPLFLILLDEYERWSGDAELVRRLEPNARAALAWIEGPGDLDGDGYLEYQSRSPEGLDNHGWKDSRDAIPFADGTLADGPIAPCEIQGYAYDARLRTARLARSVWGDRPLAARLERDAAELRERFNRDFWAGRRRYYALALDGRKRRVDSIASNPGHLLWSGIVPDERAPLVARRLLGPQLFSGWGIRTMAADETAYSPLAYHTGTVWPHDCALIAEGLRRYDLQAEAARVAHALLDAATAFEHRLPELFAGFDRDRTGTVGRYPAALAPQAWAAGAPLLALRTLLGLDVVGGRLRRSPHVPAELGRVRLRGVRVRGSRRDTP